ncbi:MAG: PLP-dependent transferase, partial [Candidatus Aenigmarchaeota archaeon]|nr:PLP-dependent transferase [Candidatus Aenigmarchaeota archaeon]MDI6722061.1 PLP-dependent transferase [Candidatus Aenigmarchaeota archaeon]
MLQEKRDFRKEAVRLKTGTNMVHSGKIEGDLITPIHLSTTFIQKNPRRHKGFEYSRVDNPTRSELQRKIAELEGGKFCLVFSSGQAAGASVILSLLKAGDHILCSQDIYEGTIRLLKEFEKFGIDFDLIDMCNTGTVKNNIKNNTRAMWLESPSNPLLRTFDIKNISRQRKALLVVDNTMATPVFQKPLKSGADIVLHSLTKFLAGHNDVTSGAVVLNNKILYEKIKFIQHTIGAIPSPFDCFLALRGIKTLKIRMEKHSITATEISKFLKNHKKIEEVM